VSVNKRVAWAVGNFPDALPGRGIESFRSHPSVARDRGMSAQMDSVAEIGCPPGAWLAADTGSVTWQVDGRIYAVVAERQRRHSGTVVALSEWRR
jgi:hypothetical protein